MTHHSPILPTDPPSRHVNPFATCWTRPGALPFRFSGVQCAERLVEKLAAQHWRGTIVGPHGSGKSTLLESLKPALVAAGHRIHTISLHDGQRWLPTNWEFETAAKSLSQNRRGLSQFFRVREEKWDCPLLRDGSGISSKPTSGGSAGASPSHQPSFLLIIDGYEQLAWLERLRLLHRCRRAAAGILVTSHTPVRIPTLIRLNPDRRLVEQLVADLCAEVSTAITPADIAASHACHGSNVREFLFDLYDRHEQGRRGMSSLRAAS